MSRSGAPSRALAAERHPRPEPTRVRLANFMDSALVDLQAKGNLESAPSLYNPDRVAEKVVHFTPTAADVRLAPIFEPWQIEIYPYLDPPGAGAKPVRALRALRRVRRKLRDERLNVVRGRLPYFGSFAGTLAARRLGIKSVVSLGGDNRLPQERTGSYQLGSRTLSYAVERLVLRLAHRIIVPNRFTGEYVARLIGAASAGRKLVTIPWAVTPPDPGEDPGAVRTRLGLDPEQPLVLAVGFLNRYKYTETLYETALRVTEAAPVQFVFCGDGPLREAGERLFAGRRDVRILGWQEHAVVGALLRSAQVVLVPMSGFVLLEAAARARAVVAGRVEWHGELIEDGASGFLVPPEEAAGWVGRVLELLGDESLRRRLAARLQERFRADYDPARAREREKDLYVELASSSTRTADRGSGGAWARD